ncbi:hypothetical protein Lal_00021289 [Lupinus albus]|nr:hypothetical protein Lal_00021289 [Lupinus albus]
MPFLAQARQLSLKRESSSKQSWDSRLSERFFPGRERLTWEGEILGYTGRFSPEREWSRLGEKMMFWTCRGCKILAWARGSSLEREMLRLGERRGERREHSQGLGALILVQELEKRISKEEIERRKQQSLGETVKNKDGETKVTLNLRESKVDVEVVHKMGFVIDLVTHRTYKHRTDRQTAPTDEPELTAPNQPESHAPSSSSAAMPSNQMIMDELVSLRGSITTRMDALDTQNQKIHYELHRLSSKLSNMDVDEDSSEPES